MCIIRCIDNFETPNSDIMKDNIILEKKSPYGLDETVQRISENALALGWTIPGIKEVDKMIFKNGGPVVLPVRLVELCHPQYAGSMLMSDRTRFTAVLMPCTIAVYEKKNGNVYVGFIDTKVTGNIFGGKIKKIMAGPITEDQNSILNFLNK